MKNLFIAIIALVTLNACTQQKIGYVDSTELMQEYKAVKDLETKCASGFLSTDCHSF